MNTTAYDVIESFEASFADKRELPDGLVLMWLKKAIARYSVELDPLNFNADSKEFDCQLEQYVIDTLANFMKESYQEREVSRVNKIASIVGKDISLNGNGNLSKYAESEQKNIKDKSDEMIYNQMPTAYV